MNQVYCAQCGNELQERTDLPEADRKPCGNCGSTARRMAVDVFDHLGSGDSLGDAAGTVHEGQASLVAESYFSASGDVERALEVIASRSFRLEWMEPTDADGSYTAMVYHQSGELIDMAEAQTADDALLAVAERLVPSDPPSGDET